MLPSKISILLVLFLVGLTLVPGCNQVKEPAGTSPQAKNTESEVSTLTNALHSGNDAAVLAVMVNSSRQQYRGSLNLTPEEEKELAKDLMKAVPIETYDNAVVYEMQRGNEKFTFFVIKEEGAWKVYGL